MRNEQCVAARRRSNPGALFPRLIILLVGLAGFLCAAADEGNSPALTQDRLLALRLDGAYDPDRGFLQATARLSFAQPAGERRLWLAEGMQLISLRAAADPVLDFSHEAGELLARCPGGSDLELSYSGRLEPPLDPFVVPGGSPGADRQAATAAGSGDDCRFLSYVSDFYPHPRLDFSALQMSLRLPEGWNCLGSGILRGVRSADGGNDFQFENPNAKGMALVCGRFRPIGVVPGPLAVRLYGWPGFSLGEYFNAPDISRILSFYEQRFGPLAVSELNILFRRSRGLGGVSYSGLIVMSVDAAKPLRTAAARRRPGLESALAMSDAGTDLLAHEIAHQWWGGIVSWETTADNWITEGLATYCSLIYMKDLLGEKEYARIRRRLRLFVKRFAGIATPSAGGKLRLLFKDPAVYQSQVYAKPALMLAELADTLGETELLRRLRSILETRRCRSLNTEEFLNLLCGDDPSLRPRLNEWIHSRDLPKELRSLKRSPCP